jgi:hypothetical protein
MTKAGAAILLASLLLSVSTATFTSSHLDSGGVWQMRMTRGAFVIETAVPVGTAGEVRPYQLAGLAAGTPLTMSERLIPSHHTSQQGFSRTSSGGGRTLFTLTRWTVPLPPLLLACGVSCLLWKWVSRRRTASASGFDCSGPPLR